MNLSKATLLTTRRCSVVWRSCGIASITASRWLRLWATGCLSCVMWFFVKDRRIIAVHGIRNKGQAIPAHELDTAQDRMRDWQERFET